MQTSADYNQQIGIHPKELTKKIKYSVPGGLLIRLFKYERLAESKAGLITPDNEAVYTAGGRPDLRLNEADYQTRGIITALSKEAKAQTDYNEGDIVWIAEKVINKDRAFMVERKERVSLDEGYFTAFPGEIQALEI